MQSWHNDIIIDRLQQIVEAADMIQQWCVHYDTVNDFLCSPTGMAMLDASILRLQIIGEAVRAVDHMTEGKLFTKYSGTPWRDIIGLRNIIAHEYANVNYDIIVRIIKNNLSPLRTTICDIIIDLRNRN